MEYLKKPMTQAALKELIGSRKRDRFKFIIGITLAELLKITAGRNLTPTSGLRFYAEEQIFGGFPDIFMTDPVYRAVGVDLQDDKILIEVNGRLDY